MTRRILLWLGVTSACAAPGVSERDVCVQANKANDAYTRWAGIMNTRRDQNTLPADAVVAFGVFESEAKALFKLFWSWARG